MVSIVIITIANGMSVCAKVLRTVFGGGGGVGGGGHCRVKHI